MKHVCEADIMEWTWTFCGSAEHRALYSLMDAEAEYSWPHFPRSWSFPCVLLHLWQRFQILFCVISIQQAVAVLHDGLGVLVQFFSVLSTPRLLSHLLCCLLTIWRNIWKLHFIDGCFFKAQNNRYSANIYLSTHNLSVNVLTMSSGH